MAERVRALIAYDGSDDSGGALRAAGALLPGAEAVVVNVRRAPLSLDDARMARVALSDSVIASAAEKYERAARAEAEAVVERGAALARAAGFEASSAVRSAESAWRGIVDGAVELGADVVVSGSRGQGGLGRAYLGSTSSSLLHHAPCPVLVVPPGEPDLTGPVLIGFDGSDGARAAVTTAARLFSGRAAVVVHAWRSPLRRSHTGSALLAAPLDELAEIAGDLDEAFAEGAREIADAGVELARELGLEATGRDIESRDGSWRTLVAAAEADGASVIAVGSRGRGAIKSTVLGSVSAGLVHNAGLPVLVHRDRAG
jgi:nucleotide-binding universal stress UspA family protein